MALWPLWVSCPGCVSPQLPVPHHHLLAGGAVGEVEEPLTTTPLKLQRVINIVIILQLKAGHQLLERKLTLSQLKPGQCPSLIPYRLHHVQVPCFPVYPS